MKSVEERIRELPPHLQQEVEDFVDFLLERRARKSSARLRLDWAGALREFRHQFTALSLQKTALDWRGD